MDRSNEVLVGEGRSEEARKPRMYPLVALLSFAIVAWEYLLSAAFNPVNWNLTGVAAHMALDLAIVVPVVALALFLGQRLARRFGMATDEWAGVLGIVGMVSLVFLVAMAPVVVTRDAAHEWMGNTYGLSLAEIPVTQVQDEYTLQQSRQLCSFTTLRNPSLASGSGIGIPLMFRIETGVSALLLQLAVLLPLAFVAFFVRLRRRLPTVDVAHSVAFFRWWARPLRLGVLGLMALLAFCYGGGVDQTFANVDKTGGGAPFNACTDGGPVKTYDVWAINVVHTLNRYFDFTTGFMYVLKDNYDAVRTFEAALESSRQQLIAANNVNADIPGLLRVTPGLRKDPIQPLVIRANLGDCVRIKLTNKITSDLHPVSLHVLGLSHTVLNASGAIGNNTPSYALNGGPTVTYEIPIPKDPRAERAYHFADHGAGTSTLNVPPRNNFRERQEVGLFGALVIEPEGATYLDVETGAPLDTATGSNWEAIIIDPNAAGKPDGKSFREFVLLYHEQGPENFRANFSFTGALLPHLDSGALSGAYKPGGRALNYRSEPFLRRIQLNDLRNGNTLGSIRHGKNLSYASYPFGDPPTPTPRSYLGEATKTRIVHAGGEMFHVHHLHGGGDRWRRNPDADPNSDFWKGLTKVPNQNITSVHLDSQSIGPGASYNLETECGAGGCQMGEGDFLYHCHIGHHYVAGMWSFWRVFATQQTEDNDVHGHALHMDSRLFQPDNVFSNSQAPSNTPPAAAVSAGQLIGLKVDWNRTIVADSSFSNPFTQVKLSDWIKDQLPPPGVPIDRNDSTVWNWITTGSFNSTLKVFGEPEEGFAMANWKSPVPVGTRPEVKFNPKNGRYAWPLFRPSATHRPPFTARHTGAPWLGEQMIPGRMDGLCANNFVHGDVHVGLKAHRFYPLSSVTLPIQVTKATPPGRPSASDPNGMLFVLNEHKADLFAGLRPAEPLAIRSNVGDCVELLFTNEIPDGALNNNWSKVNIHSHFVQFDTQASDGVITGFSYEQSVRPYATEDRRLTAPAGLLTSTIQVNHTNRLRPGIWVGIGLGEGTCGSLLGQPFPCTEIRQIKSMTATSITLDFPLLLSHSVDEAVGVEFVRYFWYSDVDVGTVFFHTHVESKDWDHGLFGAHIVEPKGSTYHDPVSGAQIRAGTQADIHVGPSFLGTKPVADGVNGDFREFMLFVHNQNPVVGQFDLGGGTINLRAEPWSLRPGDPAYRFSSVVHGDPFTTEVRAYAGDPVVFRNLGLAETVSGVRVTGHRFNVERTDKDSDTRDAQFVGISERYDVSLEGGAGGPQKRPGDYLYYLSQARDFEAGAWGLLRVYDQAQGDLKPLPDRGFPSGSSGFPTLTVTGSPPPASAGPGNACPGGATRKTYDLTIADTNIIYNNTTGGQPGVAYFLNGDPITDTRTPMVVRVNKGQCLKINLTNLRTQRSGFSVGELLFDPKTDYGAAVGLNHDSSVGTGATRTYEYYADKELGLTLVLNLADSGSLALGAWGGVVVEPSGSSYKEAGTNNPLPGGGTGIQADIVDGGGLRTREFVALIMDAEDEFSQNRMPYPDQPEFVNSLSYSREPWALRNFLLDPANVYNSTLHGDPRHVVTLPKGASFIYRVGVPWAEMPHLATVEGHRYRQEPGMPGSDVIYTDAMIGGMTLNMEFLGGAGGDLQAPGDYLALEHAQGFTQNGLWHIVRVTDPSALGAAAFKGRDGVTVTDVESRNGKTTVRGWVGVKPSGATVPRLAVFDGVEVNGKCTGKRVGTVPVHRGSGHFQLELADTKASRQLCLQSPGGGVASGPMGNLVTERTKRQQALWQDEVRKQQLKLQFAKEFAELELMEAEQ